MNEQKTRLYRIENPNIQVDKSRFGSVSHPELIGQWFTPDYDQVTTYLNKSTGVMTPEYKRQVVDGARMLIADIPEEELPKYNISNNEIAQSLDDTEGDNYLLPRDGSVTFETIALDALLGELLNNLGNINNLKESKRRIKIAVNNLD